ncbi:hypothetical protein CJD36_005370 [Flavipsychrobacter stenotrophus]|uniref:EGF-like domain-containing protein n=1 Tax=Flavipsychrobacter stenotrophus TaxID=2077091 RepID=A0A2S7SXA2_9BACT|nr:hypothetical protein [Flavipsychrobacter stenotrophus]PQJ11237.1 hypothetical protein CJD36_005370 [Flavipsychrobacter stenotrophus]
MRSLRRITISLAITVATLCTLFYSSCIKSNDGKCTLTCNNGGYCVNDECICPFQYQGYNCDFLTLEGHWRGDDSCSPTGNYDSVYITIALSPDPTKLSITNAGGSQQFVNGVIGPYGKSLSYDNLVTGSFTATDTFSGTFTLIDKDHMRQVYTHRNGSVYSFSGNYTRY